MIESAFLARTTAKSVGRCRNRKRLIPACLPPQAGIFLLAAAAFFCGAIGLANAQQQASDPASPIIAALRAHDFAQASALSHSALADHPGDYRIWTLDGMARAGAGNLPAARTAYAHALELQPSYLPALEGAAQTDFQLGRDAGPLLGKILLQRPEDPPSHLLLGILDYRKDDCAAALDHFTKAQPVLAQQPEALTDDGVCLARLQRTNEAVTAFAGALALDPNSVPARYNLALAHFNERDFDSALEAIEPLTANNSTHADALSLAAQIYEAKGDTAHAVTVLRQALLVDPKDLDAYLQFVTLSFDHASPQVGIDIASAGVGQMPKEPRLYLVRGILLAQMGEFSRAADDFDAASRLDPRLQFLGVAQGLVQSQEHNSTAALAHFRAAVQAHPSEPYAWYLLAEALAGEGKSAGSPENREEIEAATRAVKLDPKFVEARDLLSAAFYAGGRMPEAIEQSRAALTVNPNDEPALYHLMLALRKTGHDDEARTLVEQIVRLRASSKVNQTPARRYYLYEQKAPAVASRTPVVPQ